MRAWEFTLIMAGIIMSDPCLSCILPDCDVDNRDCGLRVIDREYTKARRKGTLTDDLRTARRFAYNALYSTQRNEKRATGRLGGWHGQRRNAGGGE